jgi:hypothetical protein
MPASATDPRAVTLSDEERSLLFNYLEQKLRDKQVEEHRTEASEFRDFVQHEEALIQGLLDKLRLP